VRAVGLRTSLKIKVCTSWLREKSPGRRQKWVESSSEALPPIYPMVMRSCSVGKRHICNSTRKVNDWPVCVLF